MAVQARQYFQEGYYPTGAKRAAHKFDPSGALIKAVIIGGATPLAVGAARSPRRATLRRSSCGLALLVLHLHVLGEPLVQGFGARLCRDPIQDGVI